MNVSAADALSAARAATHTAMAARHPGLVRLRGDTYEAALVIGRGTEILDHGGRLATESVSALISSCLLPTAPVPGNLLVDLATDKGYEIVSVHLDGDAWQIRAAIFPA